MLNLLSLSHLANDINQGALPALLPFLIVKHTLSYSAAAGIMFAFTITSTVIQPLLGHLADRFNNSWLIPSGLIMAGGGLALTGLSPNYTMILLAVIMSGIGSAAFHPEAARHVDLYSDHKKATAMSYFGVGGSIGFSLGPLLMTASILYFGLNGTMVMFVPVAIVALIFRAQLRQSTACNKSPQTVQKIQTRADHKDDWGAFCKLTLTIVGKSIIFYAFLTFIPLYWTTVLQQTKLAGGMALTLFSVAGILGNFLGGKLADRFGYKTIVVSGCTLLVPTIPAFILTNNVYFAAILLALTGAFLLLTYGPTVVMGQKYIPNHVGLSSGMTLGVAFSIGGGVTPLLGSLADAHGVGTALSTITIIPVLIMFLSFTLKPLELHAVVK
ncbi:MFS transporter [Desulfuromusa kysingii]|nr:MFS transporter [Desulfuromusa kysingii]